MSTFYDDVPKPDSGGEEANEKPTTRTAGTRCLWCNGETTNKHDLEGRQTVGNHHAADCPQYRPNLVWENGPLGDKNTAPSSILRPSAAGMILTPTPDEYARENRRLKALNEDLSGQLSELRKSRSLSPDEEKDIARIRAEHYRMTTDENKIAAWLREHKAEEIALGRHSGMSLAEVVIMYMGKGVKLKGERRN